MSGHHITLPKSSLLRFSKSGKFYYLDVKNNIVKQAFARTYNKVDDYYPNEIEKFLSDEIETVMGRLYKKLDSFVSNKDYFIYYPEIKEDIIRIVAIQRLRIKDTQRLIKSKSLYTQFFYLPDEYYSPLHRVDTELLQQSITLYNDLLVDYEVNFCIVDSNFCSSTFLLPTSHCLCFGNIIFIILSPKYAFVLHPKELKHDLLKNQYICNNIFISPYFVIDNVLVFKQLHEKYIEAEKSYDNGILIGQKHQLQEIQKRL